MPCFYANGISRALVFWPHIERELKMKKDIHPKYNELTLVFTNGSSIKTRSTLDVGTLKLDIDPYVHSAWTGTSARVNENVGSVASFNKRFAGFSLDSIGKKKS